MKTRVGVLAVQGDFAKHLEALARIGVQGSEVRKARELAELTHLVLPGGESTTLLKFLREEGFEPALRAYHASGRAIFATCAGVILLAREVLNPAQASYGLIDLAVERNAYGRQVSSFVASLEVPELGPAPLEAVFIRAPVIRRVGPEVAVLARHEGRPVLVRDANVLAATFHPELGEDTRVHESLLGMTPANRAESTGFGRIGLTRHGSGPSMP